MVVYLSMLGMNVVGCGQIPRGHTKNTRLH